MKTKLLVIPALLAATVAALAEMRTWTFEKSGKTIQGEVVGFTNNAVSLKDPAGKTFSIPILYLTESNRLYLTAERAKQEKEVEVVKLVGVASAGRYKKCTVHGESVSGEILIQFLPASVETILNTRNQQTAEIADYIDQLQRQLAARAAGGTAPTSAGGRYTQARPATTQGADAYSTFPNSDDPTGNLVRLRTAHAAYIDKTRPATMVKLRNTGLVYEGLPVWECFDSRKR